jgi:hypothetical protein
MEGILVFKRREFKIIYLKKLGLSIVNIFTHWGAEVAP